MQAPPKAHDSARVAVLKAPCSISPNPRFAPPSLICQIWHRVPHGSQNLGQPRATAHRRAPCADARAHSEHTARRVDSRSRALVRGARAASPPLAREPENRGAILVSEVMLQQTQVARVVPRWEAFLARWPTPDACASAPLSAILREWQGLGYPRRARALHDTAGIVATSGWPDTETGLRSLPGVGPYTARALRVLAFGASSVPPQDVNIARVTARAALGHRAPRGAPNNPSRSVSPPHGPGV